MLFLFCFIFWLWIVSDLFKVVKVFEKGEVICVFIDIVYVLVGFCSKLDFIFKIYYIKGRLLEKLICFCIFNL